MSIREVDGVLRVEGPMSFATAAGLLEAGRPLVAAASRTLDLAAVNQADSAGLALLLDWQRIADEHGHTLSVGGLPPAMASLAKLYGVEAVLPPQAA